jgi:hypothetical protein
MANQSILSEEEREAQRLADEETIREAMSMLPQVAGIADHDKVTPFEPEMLRQLLAPPQPTPTAAGPAPGAPTAPAFPSVPRLPEFISINAGETAELQRLRQLEQEVMRYVGMQAPQERALGPVAATASGILSAIDPQRAAQLQPEIDRYRRGPVEQFERERLTAGQNISAQAALNESLTGAEDRQAEQVDLQSIIDQHFANAPDLIDAAAKMAQEAAEIEDDPVEEGFSRELMRRTLMYRELIDNAQKSENELGPKFAKMVESELQGITDLINDHQDYRQQREIQLGKTEMQIGKTEMQIAGRAAQVKATLQTKRLDKLSREYVALQQLEPILDRLDTLALEVGTVEGKFPTDASNEFDRFAANLKHEILFGEAGKALTITERVELAAMVPDVGSFKRTKRSQVAGARLKIQNKLQAIRITTPGIEQFNLEAAEAGILEPGESIVGTYYGEEQ